MQLSLNVIYSKLPSDIKNAAGLTRFLIEEVVNRKYPNGLPKTESRMYAKVLDQFWSNADTIDIDDSTFLFIKEALDAVNLPPAFSSWKWSLIAYLETIDKK